MDQLFWGEDWQAINDETWQKKEKIITAKPKWIIEGYIDSDYTHRLGHSNTIIFLDYSGLHCAWNGLKRWWHYRKTSRPELPENCLEKFDIKFLLTMLFRKERGEIIKALEDAPQDCEIIVFKKSKHATNWLKTL